MNTGRKEKQMEEEIIKCIEKISGSYNPQQVFSDWVQLMALATQNACWLIKDKFWEDREEKYLAVIKKYKQEEQKMMCEMHGMLTECFEDDIKDYLGEIYMKSGAGSKQTGQFFTPFHLAELTGRMLVQEVKAQVKARIESISRAVEEDNYALIKWDAKKLAELMEEIR